MSGRGFTPPPYAPVGPFTSKQDYEASRKRLGIREERVWFQSLPDAEMAVVYWEGDDPRGALEQFASSDDPFDEWLKERGREVYHFEPGQTLEDDEEVFASSVGPMTPRSFLLPRYSPNLVGGSSCEVLYRSVCTKLAHFHSPVGLLGAYHQHRAGSAADDRIGDAPLDGPPDPTVTPASHNDQAHPELPG